MPEEKLREEKQRVKQFYETFGGCRNAAGIDNDTALFTTLAPILHDYYERNDQRVRRYLGPRGAYFLDAGSGPVPHEGYMAPSSGYKLRVCVDFAKRRLARVPGALLLWRMVRRRRVPPASVIGPGESVPAPANRPKLYFHAHPYRWLRKRSRADCDIEVHSFSAVDRYPMLVMIKRRPGSS